MMYNMFIWYDYIIQLLKNKSMFWDRFKFTIIQPIVIRTSWIGTFENFNINTLNLKSRRLVYATTMSKSFGFEEYIFNVIVEWKCGFYQIKIKIQELEGNLKYEYEYYDINGEPIDFKKLESSILK